MRKIFGKIRALPVPFLLKNKYFLTGIVFFTWILLLDPINLIDLLSEKLYVSKLNDDKLKLERSIQIMKRRIEAFSNLDSLEKVAREQFYFVGADEEIFIIEE